MSGKLLTEIIRRTDGEQILSVTLNQINSTRIRQKTTRVCSALTIVRFNHNKSKMYTPKKGRMVGKLLEYLPK